ncbi:hypothetical protein [Thalassospira xiamenensis]|nr:hypothetical protein [Thalassospira xiamenensis]
MNLISKIIKSISIGMKISKSWEYLANGSVDLADKEVDKLFKVYKNPLPDDLVFGGYVRFRAKRFQDAVQLFERGLVAIEESKKINQDTKNYLKIYVRKPMAVSLAMIQKKSVLFDKLVETKFDINLRNVPDRIKSVHRIENLEGAENVRLIE